jgi:hypothetical protein
MKLFYGARLGAGIVLPSLLFCLTGAPCVAQNLSSPELKSKTRMSDTLYYGEARQPSKAYDLSAGPIRLKFQDGELRYLRVGDKEIVRRIYFAVRNSKWNTSMPVFSVMNVKQEKNGFTIDLKAACKTVNADFEWTGKIIGTPEGKITFQASGAAGSDFGSNRIGLCVLYGSPSLVGQKFETVNAAGEVKPNVFPEFVSPSLVAPDFRTLRYTTADGMTVTTTVTGQANFDMEDQRTYSDSSFKAYAPLGYNYKAPIPKGDSKEEILTVELKGAKALPAPKAGPVVVRVGAVPVPGAKVPKITTGEPSERSGIFGAVNGKAEANKGASALTWGYGPAVHLPDDDTFFENLTNIQDAVKTAHSYAPGAAITLDPISFTSSFSGPSGDPRNKGLLAAAWSAALLKYASLAGVSEAHFELAGYAKPVQEDLSALTGKALRDVTREGGAVYPLPVEAFAVEDGAAVVVYLINQTGVPQKAEVHGLPFKDISLRRFFDKITEETAKPNTALKVELKPFEVVRVRVGG